MQHLRGHRVSGGGGGWGGGGGGGGGGGMCDAFMGTVCECEGGIAGGARRFVCVWSLEGVYVSL